VLGGLERQILDISENLSSRNHNVMVISLDSGELNSFYGIPEASKVVWRGLGIGSPNRKANLKEKIKRQIKLIKIIRDFDPDISVSFMIGAFIYSRLPHFICRKKLILSERNSPDIYRLTSANKYRYLYFFLMLFANRITVQFNSYRLKYPIFLRHKIISIPNSIVLKSNAQVYLKNEIPQFIYAGRFSFQKQLGKLIKIFVAYRNQGGKGELALYGDGEAKEEILELIKDLEATSYISINPPANDMNEVFKQATYNCLFSMWEGFPNSLAEGLKFGIPAIGFENCDGVSDMIVNNFNGWLLTDDGNYSRIGGELLKLDDINQKDFDKIIINCKASIAKYSDQVIFQKWIDLFVSVKSSSLR
jgi:glycosyltransferase involved in cell wall biosynthesis